MHACSVAWLSLVFTRVANTAWYTATYEHRPTILCICILAVVLENSRMYDRALMRSRRSSIAPLGAAGGDGDVASKSTALMRDFVIELRNADNDLVRRCTSLRSYMCSFIFAACFVDTSVVFHDSGFWLLVFRRVRGDACYSIEFCTGVRFCHCSAMFWFSFCPMRGS